MVVHGVVSDGVLAGDDIDVKHDNKYIAANPDRVERQPAVRRQRADERQRRTGASGSAVIVAASVNGAFGKAGLMLAARRGDAGRARRPSTASPATTRRSLRLAPLLHLAVRRRCRARVLMMQRALITRDFSLAYVQQVGSAIDAAALQHRRDVVGPRGVDPAVGADPRRLHGGGRLALPQPHERPARRLGAGRDVRRDGVLRPAVASARPTRSATARPGSPPDRDPTRCCRTTSSCCSTRRSSTSATSA